MKVLIKPDSINFTNSGEEFLVAQRVIFQKMVDLSTTIACKDKRKVKICLKLKKKGKCSKKRVWKKCKKTCNKCWDLKTRQHYIKTFLKICTFITTSDWTTCSNVFQNKRLNRLYKGLNLLLTQFQIFHMQK